MIEGGWTEGSMFASQMGRFRPFPELSGFRTRSRISTAPSNSAFGAGIGRGSSYIAYKVIAEDLGLARIWEQAGRQF